MILRLFLGLCFISAAFMVPFYFQQLLFFSIKTLGLGWVTTTILIRLLSIILLAISLKCIFSAFSRLKKIKFWLVFLIAILPGFGISFIVPIYTSDYGMINDNKKLENLAALDAYLPTSTSSNYALYSFFTTTCGYCMSASEKLGANITAGQTIPVYAIFPGNGGDKEAFLTTHDGLNFTSCELNDDNLFMSLCGNSFPSIFLVDKSGKTLYHWTGDEMNYSALDYLRSLE